MTWLQKQCVPWIIDSGCSQSWTIGYESSYWVSQDASYLLMVYLSSSCHNFTHSNSWGRFTIRSLKEEL